MWGYPLYMAGKCSRPEDDDVHSLQDAVREIDGLLRCDSFMESKRSCIHHVYTDDEFTQWVYETRLAAQKEKAI